MGLIFRISILFLFAIFINIKKDVSAVSLVTGTGDGTDVVDGGNGKICYTKNEVRTREIQHGGQTFQVPYYVIVQYCSLL